MEAYCAQCVGGGICGVILSEGFEYCPVLFTRKVHQQGHGSGPARTKAKYNTTTTNRIKKVVTCRMLVCVVVPSIVYVLSTNSHARCSCKHGCQCVSGCARRPCHTVLLVCVFKFHTKICRSDPDHVLPGSARPRSVRAHGLSFRFSKPE